MRTALTTLALAVAIFLGFAIQPFVPPMDFAAGARLFLAPVFFCYGACVLPYPLMLLLALETGFLADFHWLQIVPPVVQPTELDNLASIGGGSVEISPGWSILLFVAAGSIGQGLRALVLRGQWWWPPLLSATTTIAYLAAQFLMITLRRFDTGGLYWSETVLWRILAPGLVASLLSLILVLCVTIAGGFMAGRRPLREF
jgi:hypothetical protein